MRTVEEAQESVLLAANRLDARAFPLQASLGLVLGQDITSDLDSPPFDKALVDGFAVRAADIRDGHGEPAVVAELVAGQPPLPDSFLLAARQAVRIMTGAPVPAGADAVVMVERTESVGGNLIRIDDPRFKPGQNIMRRGTELTRGQVVLRAGALIRPPEIGLLAEVGRARVSVYPRPRVAVVSTGNEIVEADQAPGPGQIRNSNGPMLAALVARAGGAPQYLGIARDTRDDLRRLILQGLEADVLILSGGVSAGQLDLVPGVLRELGVREVFHKVNLKPGKPVWFGVFESPASSVETPDLRSEGRAAFQLSTLNPQPSTLVFGLPGNPVSVMACFELFVKPTIRKRMGFADPLPRVVSARLMEDKQYRTDRPTYWPAWLEMTEDGYRVRPVAWHGSPDLRATTGANAFAVFPAGEHEYRAGDPVQVMRIE